MKHPPREQTAPTALTAALVLSAAVALLYGMVLAAPVFNEDISHVDNLSLFDLPFGAFWTALTSKQYFFAARERTYQPLVTFLHYWIHGSPALYRAAGLALHALNAFLVFLVGVRVAGRRRTALLAALLFALFPCQTEAVDIASFKGHLLGCAFMLACLLCWIRALERPPKESRWALAGVHVFFALGLLAKESALMTPAFLALYAVCFSASSRDRAWRCALGLAPTAALYVWWRFSWLTPPPAFPYEAVYSGALSLGWYLKMMAWPHPLCLESSPVSGAVYWLLPAAYVAVLWSQRRVPPRVFCLLWMLLALLPVLHLVSFANISPVADRYLYASSVGLSLLLAGSLDGPRTRFILYALLGVWGGLTAQRNGLYRTPRQLWEQTASCAPANARAHYILALTCLREDDVPAAERSLRRVLDIKDSVGAHTLLGDIAWRKGEPARARRHYAAARALQPDWDRSHPAQLEYLLKK